MKRGILVATAACLAMSVATGCGLSALIGVTTALVLSNNGNGQGSLPRPVTVLRPPSPAFDRVPINYLLSGSGRLDVIFEYSTSGTGAPFATCTEAVGAPSQGTSALTASPSGNAHLFVWNSFADLQPRGITNSAGIVLRVTALAGKAPFGAPGTTGVFAVDNRLIATVAGPPPAGGDVVPAAFVSLVAPEAAIVGSGGDIVIADTGGARIRSVDSVTKLVTTLAGSSGAGFGGDGAPAVAAELLEPSGVALDAAGDVFISDAGNNRIRRVDAVTGVISTVAGVGSAGLAGDGGPALSAALSGPTGIVVDAGGTVFFCDTNNHCVRSLGPGGLIGRVAGTGTAGTMGDGGQATSAQLSSPRALALDASSNLLVADSGNHAVRLVANGTMTTIAGTLGQPGLGAENASALSALSSPAGVCVVGANVYVADTGNNRVRRFTVGSTIATVAGSLAGTSGFGGDNGPATGALLASPTALAPDGQGGILIADPGNNRIRNLAASGLIFTVAGSGSPDAQNFGDGSPAVSAQFKDPEQMALAPDSSIYVGDDLGHRVRRFTIGGTISTIAGTGFPGFSGDGGVATSAQLNQPFAVAVDRNGVIFIGDSGNALIRAINLAGIITTVMGGGSGPDGVATATSFGATEAILARANGSELLVADTANSSIRRMTYQVDAAGNVTNGVTDTVAGIAGQPGYTGDLGLATNATLSSPFGMDEDGLGNIYLLDQFAAVVRKFQIGGMIQTIAGTGTCGYSGDGGPATLCEMCAFYLKFDAATGFIYVTDFTNNRVRRFQEGGTIDTVAGTGGIGDTGLGGPATSAPLALNSGIVILPGGSIVTGSDSTKQIYQFTVGGNITAVAGAAPGTARGDGGPAVSATIFQPMPAIGPDGTLYVAELNFGRVRRVDPKTGILTTLVGQGVLGDKGFGGPLANAFVDEVTGMAVDSSGNIFLAEINQSIISKVDLAVGTITTAVGIGPGATSGGDGGPALQATLQFPEGVCFSPRTHALYFTDSNAGVVRRVDAQTTIITTVAGGGAGTADGIMATQALLTSPSAVACDSNETIYVANRAPESTVRSFTVGGTIQTVAGIAGQSGFNGDGVRGTQATLNNPQGLAVDSSFNVYISDSGNNRVRRIDVAGFVSTLAGTGDRGSGPDGVPAIKSQLNGPRQISLDGNGNIYVGEEFGNRVRRFRLFP